MMTKEVLLRRFRYEHGQILGNLLVFDQNGILVFDCATLELNYIDNKIGISSIPAGTYPMVFEYSPSFDMMLWEIKNVPGRSEVKFHPGNYSRQLKGCIALGREHLYIDSDRIPDIAYSRDTVERFHSAMAPDTQAYLTIIGKA